MSLLVAKDCPFLVVLDFVWKNQCIWLFWVRRWLVNIELYHFSFPRTSVILERASEAVCLDFQCCRLVLFTVLDFDVYYLPQPLSTHTYTSSFFKLGNKSYQFFTSLCIFLSLCLLVFIGMMFSESFKDELWDYLEFGPLVGHGFMTFFLLWK